MSQQDLVSSLRSKARRHSSQTSRFRGVSLLKQTGKWHAQINFGGKQLHLGFFAVEARSPLNPRPNPSFPPPFTSPFFTTPRCHL